jgi:cyclopropane fatty-acyl-phospholipid synthase-like methyltransferase
MRIAAAQLGPLTERRWPTLVGRDCASMAAGIEPIAEQLVDSAGLRAGDTVLDVASATGNVAIAAARRLEGLTVHTTPRIQTRPQ